MKYLLIAISVFWMGNSLKAQTATAASFNFIESQKSFPRISDVLKRKEDTLRKQFEEKRLPWPAKYIYIRSFKYDSQLEVWVKYDMNEKFRLFKTYKVCALAGTLGPKRMQGDYQVPEGFYYINEFNAKSTYHLSLGLNYPNVSDKILSDSYQPGGDIYIHGSCVTVGCIPLTDPMIEEVYILTAHAKDQGQDFIPVHIFPIRYNVKRSLEYFEKLVKDDIQLQQFSTRLEDAFNYFEKHKQVPIVMVTERGEYIVNDPPAKKVAKTEKAPVKVKRQPVQHRVREISGLAEAVYQWPKFPGGGEAFLVYLESIGKQMAQHMPAGLKKVYAQVEFIIDTDGTPVNFKVLKGVDEDFDDELITKLEKTMQNWEPAMVNGKLVAKKMVQTVTVEALADSE